MNIIEQMLNRYRIETKADAINAVKEVFQEITLLGLYRSMFFEKACFYGGSALRILYGLDRFSEDLDFSLFQRNDDFDLEKYFSKIIDEFKALGINIFVSKKIKQGKSDIETAFLKVNLTDIKVNTQDIKSDRFAELLKNIHPAQKIKIKVEVDINPPLKFQTESKIILLPTTFYIVSMTLPNLYAGKIHSLLFRVWANRVKGRDWYDFEWYIKNGVELNLEHLKQRIIKSEDWEEDAKLTEDILKDLIIKKIDTIDIKKAKDEVKPFIKNYDALELWSKKHFKILVEKIKFERK